MTQDAYAGRICSIVDKIKRGLLKTVSRKCERDVSRRTGAAYLSVLADIATIPSGHCSEEKLEAYSRVSYDSGVR